MKNNADRVSKIADMRNASGLKGSKRWSWTDISRITRMTKKEVDEIRGSKEYAVYVANEIIWGVNNNSVIPYNLKSAFGVNEATAEFLEEIRGYAGFAERTDDIIDEFLNN